ncbi:BNR repeat domain protein [Enhygromyxa salina]|uniref:BNR repeat domain protein n=1 Tax=Enhygromyxa salina TaxID=215803 RepID=A0A0C2D2Q9_9BACT|nr:BNR repeat domain protein [Enhygromyxa salina]
MLMSSCLVACPSEPDPPEEGWEIVHRGLPGALLSVWGTSSTNVWAVGGDSQDGLGPTIIHFDGETWTRVESGQTQGSLWWVFGFEDGPVFMGGEGGVILRYEAGEFTLMDTPGTDTVFGIWGASADDVWAVGGASDSTGGFVWRLSGDTWTPEPSLPAEVSDAGSIWKVFGTSPDDAWLVGSNGVAMHWDGTALTLGDSGVGSSLFTVHASEDRYVAVGGAATGIISEYEAGQWTTVAVDPPAPGLSGVALGEDDFGVAVGSFGAVYTRSSAGWAAEDLGFNLGMTLHAAWIDDQGCVWAVGGQVYSPPFNDGLLIHRGPSIPSGGL